VWILYDSKARIIMPVIRSVLSAGNKLRILIVSFVLFAILLTGCTGVEITHYYENGVVATAAPIATAIGLKIFEQGGNAFDVAVAVGFALAVVHPEAGNLGGGGFALIRDGKTGDVRALDFRETAPQAATETMYLDRKGEVIPELSTFGALASGVPGTVAGLYELWRNYGSLPWDSLVQLSVRLADTGFIVDEYLSQSLLEYRQQLTAFDETAAVFFPEGQSLNPGDRLIQKDLARTLFLIAREGAQGFYQGETADKIVACMQKHGGLITAEDLESYQPIWREPIHFTFDSLEIYSMPPPSSGGIVLGQILKLLEPFDFSGMTPTTPQYIHLFSEAARLAFADRAVHLGDPDFYNVPGTLLDSVYLEQRRKLINPRHVTPSDVIQAGTPPPESEQTTHFSVCDKDGNMVAVTYTLNSPYGCKLVVDGAGFLLNNEMDDFSIKPGAPNIYGLTGGEANKIEPGKRMLSSMSPTLVLRRVHMKFIRIPSDETVAYQGDLQPYLVLGSPGGPTIITTVTQAILNQVRFGLSLSKSAAQPRFHHQWQPDILYLEQGAFDINVTQELIRYGHTVQERKPYGDLQAIFMDENGLMTGTSDPRKRGTWAGY
jgi:gamma-glutamyltranspeptidase/glutathione hydrolase